MSNRKPYVKLPFGKHGYISESGDNPRAGVNFKGLTLSGGRTGVYGAFQRGPFRWIFKRPRGVDSRRKI